MPEPSPDARVFAERVCSVQVQLPLPRAFIDHDLGKFVAWNSRFLKALSLDSIRKRMAASRQWAKPERVRFGRPVKLSEEQISEYLPIVFKTQLRLHAFQI